MPTDLEIIEELEKEIGKGLKQVDFEKVTEVTNSKGYAIDEHDNIIGLNLCSLDLNYLPDSVLKLKSFIKLTVYDNQIKDLPIKIKELKNLEVLFLHGNNLKTLPITIFELKNLKDLSLGENKLTLIPTEIIKLKKLHALGLYNNQLNRLPKEILELGLDISGEYLGGNKGIDLTNNPLESPPIEIVKKGREAVIDYFKSLEGEKQALNEVKVLLVGDGGAGKTSLVKQLLGEEFDKQELQTHGINIRDWEVKEGDKSIGVHLWDFGGQEIMHATHQFFLSKRSLYILVLDGRKDEKTEYWLKHIESFGGDSPILVVLNKIDENPGFDVNRRFLQEKYNGIKNFYRVSCAKKEGIEVFADGLSKALANVKLIQTTWATSWFNVKTQLENMKKNVNEYFISYEKYKEMCTKEKIIEKSSQDTLVDFLNDLGVILHFRDIALLDTHVLEPKWITNAVYRIINSKKLAECNGVLRLGLLDEILKKKEDDDYYYPREKYRYIIDLMKKFELCYEIDRQTVLLPDLLEVQEPEFDFDYAASLKFVINYDFLPKSVMPRFIVKMNKDIKNELRWRTGVVLEDKAFHTTAVIKADARDEKIYIYVNGEQKRDYFSAIRKTFGDINDCFEKLDVTELVPLPDNDEIAIEYEELIGYEQMNKDDYTVGKLRKTYSIKQLLDGIVSEEERKKEYEKISKSGGGDFYLSIAQNQTNIQTQDVKQDVNIKIELKIELPAIQSDFSNFKREVSKLDEDLKDELKEIEDDVLEITPNSEQGKINKAMNKLSLFMQKLGDEDSKYHKLISRTQKGIDLAQKLGRTYNKFAQWLALPQVPYLFLGK